MDFRRHSDRRQSLPASREPVKASRGLARVSLRGHACLSPLRTRDSHQCPRRDTGGSPFEPCRILGPSTRRHGARRPGDPMQSLRQYDTLTLVCPHQMDNHQRCQRSRNAFEKNRLQASCRHYPGFLPSGGDSCDILIGLGVERSYCRAVFQPFRSDFRRGSTVSSEKASLSQASRRPWVPVVCFRTVFSTA